MISFGLAESRGAHVIQNELQDEGKRIGDVDVMIAATAAMHDLPVLTRNVDEFARIAEIDVETY